MAEYLKWQSRSHTVHFRFYSVLDAVCKFSSSPIVIKKYLCHSTETAFFFFRIKHNTVIIMHFATFVLRNKTTAAYVGIMHDLFFLAILFLFYKTPVATQKMVTTKFLLTAWKLFPLKIDLKSNNSIILVMPQLMSSIKIFICVCTIAKQGSDNFNFFMN